MKGEEIGLPKCVHFHVARSTRVSTTSQKLDGQMDALAQAGCARTFTDKMSGAKSSRPGWDELLAYMALI